MSTNRPYLSLKQKHEPAWVFFQPPWGEVGLDFPAETADPRDPDRENKTERRPLKQNLFVVLKMESDLF